MADQKITQLPTLAAPTDDDLLVVVDDPAGTPATKSLRVDALLTRGFPPVTFVPLNTTSWTWVNQGPATLTESGGLAYFLCPAVGTTENIRAKVTTIPGGTPTITAAFAPNPLLWIDIDYSGVGLVLRESATSKLVSFMLQVGGSAYAPPSWALRKNTNPTTISSGVNGARVGAIPGLIFARVQLLSTTYAFSSSFDGLNYQSVFSENKNAFFTTAPDQVGLMAFNNIGTLPNAHGASWAHWLVT